jgi:hypothetical protein
MYMMTAKGWRRLPDFTMPLPKVDTREHPLSMHKDWIEDQENMLLANRLNMDQQEREYLSRPTGISIRR